MAGIDAALKKRNKQIILQANPLFDELNSAWDKIEKFFRTQGILQSAYYSYDVAVVWPNQNESQQVGEFLIGIQKLKGKWHICHGVLEYRDGEISGWTPVAECSTELRIELLDHVDKLFERLVEANEKYVPEIEQAVAKSQSVLKDLGIS